MYRKARAVRIAFAIISLFMVTAFAAADVDPVAHYSFNGNANDASGNGNNGTVYGATLTADRLGNLNSAYNFDGTAYIEIPTSTSLSLDNLKDGYTIAAWVRSSVLPTSIANVQSIVSKENRNMKLWMTYYDEGTFFSAYHRVATITSYSFNNTTLALAAGTWYHAAMTWDGPGGDLTIWVNGGSPRSAAFQPAALNQTLADDGPILIGKTQLAIPQYFNGAIDEVKIWDRPLGAAEIMELYNKAPVAAGDAYTTDEDTTLAVGAPGVLINDTDADPDVLSVVSIDTTGTAGTVGYSANGGFSYDPAGQFESLPVGNTAVDTFAYTMGDGVGGTDVATVTVTVNGVNDAPDIPSNLLADGEVNPANVTDYTPILSWSFADVDAAAQTAFQVQIRDAGSLLVYDSSQVVSSTTSMEIPPVLSPNEEYTWFVQVWDQYGPSGFSAAATFTILDIGLGIYDGTEVIKIAVDYSGPGYELRMSKEGTIYGIILVDPADPDASNIRIQTSTGIKALKKMR